MKIEIKLPDPKYCNGCPCSFPYHFGKIRCTFFHEIILLDPIMAEFIRPKICVERNGL